MGAAVLLYHRVAEPEVDPHGLAVSPAHFESQMAILCRHYRVMPLTELVEAVAGGVPIGRAVAITFDDGYVDNYTCASPILMQLGLPATFFVTTECLDGDYHFWWDVLAQALLAGPHARPASLTVDSAGIAATWPTATHDERLAAHRDLWEKLFRASGESRADLLRQIERWAAGLPVHDPASRRMTPGEMRSLARRPGHEIGAHSVHHIALAGQPSDVQRAEITGSGIALEELIGQRIAAFSYPFGQRDAESLELVRATFDVGVTVESQCVTSTTDRLCVPRYVVTPERSASFPAWVDGVFDERGAR